jgi:ribosomal protein S18 acetylase RimI-like enzyme
MNAIIRSLLSEDIEIVISLWAECGLVVSWNDPRKDFQRKLDHGRDQFLVCELNGEIVASAMYAYDGHRGSVNYLAVLPEFQSKGIGLQLMKDIENRLTGLGCPKINILIRQNNVGVIKFYESLGYKTDPVVCVSKRLIADN